METIADFSFFPIEFTKEGDLFKGEQRDELLTFLSQKSGTQPVSDLLVLSHGWNNDLSDAHQLYEHLLASLNKASGATLSNRLVAVVGIFWPSKRFTEKDLIPGGGAASLADNDQPEMSALQAQFQELVDTFQNAPSSQPIPDSVREGLQKSQEALIAIEDSPAARNAFLEGLRMAMQPESHGVVSQQDADADEIFLTKASDTVWQNLLAIPLLEESSLNDGAIHLGDGLATTNDLTMGGSVSLISNLLDKFRTGAEMVMNLTTYYTMKARAGAVGQKGAYQLLKQITEAHPELRLHLVGHSFGGRLVTAIALGPDNALPLPIASLTLLQAAFSHNGFSPDFPTGSGGFFKRVLLENRVKGPIVITFTRNDLAVGYAYPLASRLARTPSESIGDANDLYGGIGRNGALHLDGLVTATIGTLLDNEQAYQFEPGKVYNLNADTFIKEHSDVTGVQVAHAIVSAMTTLP